MGAHLPHATILPKFVALPRNPNPHDSARTPDPDVKPGNRHLVMSVPAPPTPPPPHPAPQQESLSKAHDAASACGCGWFWGWLRGWLRGGLRGGWGWLRGGGVTPLGPHAPPVHAAPTERRIGCMHAARIATARTGSARANRP